MNAPRRRSALGHITSAAAAEMTDDPQLKKTLLVFADVEKGHKKRLEGIYDERVLTEG